MAQHQQSLHSQLVSTYPSLSITNIYHKTGTIKHQFETFITCALLIIFSELGDKTFFIIVILSSKFSRNKVFIGAIFALVTMTILSISLGILFIHIISKTTIQFLSFSIYGIYGCYILYDAYNMDEKSSKSDHFNEAYKDVDNIESKICMQDLPLFLQLKITSTKTEKCFNFFKIYLSIIKRYLNPIILQAFLLVFMAEWGDRSQIATVLMAQKNMISASLGAILGHLLCTLSAVLCGWLVSSISMRKVNIFSGICFILFAVCTIFG